MKKGYYSEEDKDAWVEEVIEAGIPPTGLESKQWWLDRVGRSPSKSTLSYWINPEQRKKAKNRNQRLRKTSWKFVLINKIDQFCRKTARTPRQPPKRIRTLEYHFKERTARFSIKGTEEKKSWSNMNFSVDELLEAWKKHNLDLENKTVRCYLTGQLIDLTETKEWHMDHIIPVSRGGPNTLENCAPATRVANQAKGNLLVEEFYELCEKALEYKRDTKCTR
jgi:5-methylcytosine-specific restriction endonuclease McrA